ncbi:MAG: adenine phosphoribosyltransferase [Clostridia bacterium]|nr:adenine phosphoribosyltransferase [Eubacteriales bacterium]MDD3866048.1 adenine phosphoribosyltransferase [Eubacteriales bacterium]MDD4461049.1 adenine phosphoribosyltransferase [Eubacteriales bacterium]NCC47865.1 adenine phosphoribosyltransferase [Clostridia bacterium]
MDLAKVLRHIPNFPKQGIDFIDITTVLQNADAFQATVDQMADKVRDVPFSQIVGSESRGFILGAPLAYAMKRGFIPVRKKGKLPWQTVSAEYELEYGKDILEMHVDAFTPGTRVLVVDDLLATGGTARATCQLIEQLGGIVAGVLFFIEIEDLGGRSRLNGYPVYSLVSVRENIPD